jgi:DNA-binding NarL/FixJ family response regulator
MRILIVEDEDDKRDAVVQCVRHALDEVVILQAKSLQSGLRAMHASAPDLLIVDMTMPSFDVEGDEDGGRQQAYAGRELLRHVRRTRPSVCAIVLTQFSEFPQGGGVMTLPQLDQTLRQEYGDAFIDTIHFNTASDSWKHLLVQAIESCERKFS